MISMDIDPTQLESLRKHLEQVSGQEVTATAEQLISLWYPASTVTFTDGSVVSRNVLLALPPRCDSANILDVGGSGVTDAGGSRSFSLVAFLCPSKYGYSFSPPVTLIATPRSSKPFFVTVETALVPVTGLPHAFSDVTLTIYSWTPGGEPAPAVGFDWRCRAVNNVIIP